VPLSNGTRLGPYEIVAPLGAGGMGEVYRARDTRLNRDVALKVMPADMAQDPVRQQRFEHEARAASALNHPNIVSVFDVGKINGISFIVSELVEGESLRAVMQRAPMGRRQVTELGVQIAEGLAAAHAAAIVHRDLKPENIMVTRDGRAKILDFGLAKQMTVNAGDATVTVNPTQPGTIMGTVAYMSPEQVRGKPADHRSDIFAFGAILYEMSTGHRPFAGDTPADVMSAILTGEPPEVPDTLTPPADRLIRRCLEKEPNRRFQSAQDLAFGLQGLTVTVTPGGGTRALAPPVTRRGMVGVLTGAGIAVAAGAAGFVRGRSLSKTVPATFVRMTYRRGLVTGAAFAPDGQTIVYSASWDGTPNEVFTTRIGSPESRSLGLAGARLLAVSSKGELAVALDARYKFHYSFFGTLARVALSGGAPRTVLRDVHEAAWTPDGEGLAVVHQVDGQERLEYPIGKILYESTGWINHVQFSPQGDRIAFLDHPVKSDDRGNVVVVDLAGKASTVSTGWSAERGLVWKGNGEIWFTGARSGQPHNVWAVPAGGGDLHVVASVPVGLNLWDMTRDGRVLLEQHIKRSEMLGITAGERQERNLAYLDNPRSDDISPDGKTLLFTEQGEAAGGMYALCVRGLDGSPATRLGEGRGLALSPDGKWALSLLYSNPLQLLLWPTAEGQPRRLGLVGLTYGLFASWTPDSRRILYTATAPKQRARIWTQEIDGGEPVPVTPEGAALVGFGLSPDGDRVAATHPDGAIAIYPLGGSQNMSAKPAVVPGIEPGERLIRWDQSGRHFFLYQPAQLPARIFRVEIESGHREMVREIMPEDRTGVFSIRSLQMSPDAHRLVYSFYRMQSELYVVTGLI
jgi:eukaryotic-like serine/threonine-protein kinase